MWYRGTAQSIPDATNTTLLVDTQQHLNNDASDISFSAGVITINTTGVYMIMAGIGWATNATGYRLIYIMTDGSTSSTNRHAGSRVLPNSSAEQSVATTLRLTATRTVEINVYQTSGGNLNTIAGTRDFLSIVRIS
jgi:hypothetical protein